MDTSRTTSVPEAPPLDDSRPVTELSLVDIAGKLERITSMIEAERSRERLARKAYQAVADQVEAEIHRIRDYARSLVAEQRRRIASFDGMLGRVNGMAGPVIEELKPGDLDFGLGEGREGASMGGGRANGRLSIADAILKVWTKHKAPLTTEEIAEALPDVGYTTRAAPRSIKSTLNQALAKLSHERKIRRFRTDGTEIDAADHHSRARKYMVA